MERADLVDLVVEFRDEVDELPLSDEDKRRLLVLVNRAIKRLALELVGAT